MEFRIPLLPETEADGLQPNWAGSSWLSDWDKFEAYLLKKVNSLGGSRTVYAYSHNLGSDTPVTNAYVGGVLDRLGRLWLVPGGQANQAKYHYIDIYTRTVYAYAHNLGASTPVQNAYEGGILDKKGYIWLIPSAQAPQDTWHYIDTHTGTVVPYAHGLGADTPSHPGAYGGGILAPDGKIYFVPCNEGPESKWHGIDTITNTAFAYAHNLGADTPVTSAYYGGVLAPNGKIYFAPNGQANQTKWHYLDTSTGLVHAYAHNLGADTPIQYGYAGAVITPYNKIFFVPCYQANQAKWHYVNWRTGTITAFAHGLTGDDLPVQTAYIGGALAPDNSVFFCPYHQGSVDRWHFIDSNTNTVYPYGHGFGTGITYGGYIGCNMLPTGELFLIPYVQATQSQWHLIKSHSNARWDENTCTNPLFNKL